MIHWFMGRKYKIYLSVGIFQMEKRISAWQNSMWDSMGTGFHPP